MRFICYAPPVPRSDANGGCPRISPAGGNFCVAVRDHRETLPFIQYLEDSIYIHARQSTSLCCLTGCGRRRLRLVTKTSKVRPTANDPPLPVIRNCPRHRSTACELLCCLRADSGDGDPVEGRRGGFGSGTGTESSFSRKKQASSHTADPSVTELDPPTRRPG
ncbi:hypothetical protein NDU88_002303 [Pleurodeles waltl]|uniref:Uncharacterized protein n=1 Tax=Pleurodeles waltl TaxID=8319 RepID=A0AAV7NHA4_PLEWA|nr:hypothetical protein NDU88_002303 [Pleurodeles waltl]